MLAGMGRCRRARRRAAGGDPCESPRVPTFHLGKSFNGAVLEAIDIEPSGQVRLCGWSRNPDCLPPFHLSSEGVAFAPPEEFRLTRPEVAWLFRSAARQPGLGVRV